MVDKVPHMRLHRLHSRSAGMFSTYLQVLQRNLHRVGRGVREQARYHLGQPRSQRTHRLWLKPTYQGFASSVSPTMTPSAPVVLLFSHTSSHVLTLPLLTTGTPTRSFRTRTCARSAAPCRRRRAETCRAWRVIHDAPAAARRVPRSGVRAVFWQRRILAETGTGRECERAETVERINS